MQETLRALFRFSINNENNEHQIITLFSTLEENLIAKIKLATAFDLTGFCVEIDNYGIKHAFDRHGNETKEAKQGQIAITEEDFTLIPLIITDFDSVIYNEFVNGKTIEPALVFEKEIDGRYFVVQQIKTVTKKGKQNRLLLKTMYKKRSNKQ